MNKGDTVRYLLANAEWEGGKKRATDPTWSPTLFTIRKIVVSENEPVLDGEYAPSREFVRKELMHVNPEKIQCPPQRLLLENQHCQLVHTTRVLEN